jgi:hypothetical protein
MAQQLHSRESATLPSAEPLTTNKKPSQSLQLKKLFSYLCLQISKLDD